jgi:D-alanyl-D-alanine dipeptidase
MPTQIVHNLVRVTHPHIIPELIYASPNNFTHQQLYPSTAAVYLHKDVAPHLLTAADECATHGLYLKIWDAYRPLGMQKKMWSIVPDERYVCDPSKGGYHTRGASVDVTLCDAHGNNLAMPSDFDCFDERAHAENFDQLEKTVYDNVMLLKTIMERHNFIQYHLEWWHFNIVNIENYPVLDISFEELEYYKNEFKS